MHPPTSLDAVGWSFSSYRVGSRAKVVQMTGDTMKVVLAPSETGPDSGLLASDLTISKVSYSVYLPTAHVADLKIPGCGALGAHMRAPGWNVVEVAERVTINGMDTGCPGNPGDIACYAMGPRVPEFIFLTAFEGEKKVAQAPLPIDLGVAPASRFRFAN